MKVLGVHSLTHDVGAAIAIDGQIVAAVEEERLSRMKHHPGIEQGGTPPDESVEFVLRQAGISLDDVDMIVHVGWPGGNFEKLNLGRTWFRDYAQALDPDGGKTMFVGHHEAHAASAFWGSGYLESIVLVVDAAGDWASTSLYAGRGHGMELVSESSLADSLGVMFSRAASTLGLGGFGTGEGKLTALAAYGTPDPEFPTFISDYGSSYRIVADYYERLFEPQRRTGSEILDSHRDFAATVQDALDRTVCHILTAAYASTGLDRISLAGGVALNCRLNGAIRCLPWVRDLYVQPAANDGGLCVGAAYLGAIKLGDEPQQLSHAYLGPDLPENIADVLKSYGLRFERTLNTGELGASLIERGNTVAWVQGRSEFGPRALGHRSLLGDPRKPAVRDALNAIKDREAWRPVAPAVLEGAGELSDLHHASRYMTNAIAMSAEARRQIPAGIHVDGTARVQLVTKEEDAFHDLLSAFKRRTGVPAVLNTSLNKRGEPLCNSVEDALIFYYTTPTDHLILGDCWVQKIGGV